MIADIPRLCKLAKLLQSTSLLTLTRPLSSQEPLVVEGSASIEGVHVTATGGTTAGSMAVHALKSSVLHASAAASCAPHS